MNLYKVECPIFTGSKIFITTVIKENFTTEDIEQFCEENRGNADEMCKVVPDVRKHSFVDENMVLIERDKRIRIRQVYHFCFRSGRKIMRRRKIQHYIVM